MTVIIGTPEMLTIRRDVMDAIENLMTGSMITKSGLTGTLNLSGSRREGFRFWESDFDMMSTIENLKVIWNLFQIQEYINDFSIFQVLRLTVQTVHQDMVYCKNSSYQIQMTI